MSAHNYWMTGRVSRRSALRGTAALAMGVTGAALIGCGGGSSGGAVTSTSGSSAGTSAATQAAQAAAATKPPRQLSPDEFQKMPVQDMFTALNPTGLQYLPGQVEAMKNGPTTGGTLRQAIFRTPSNFDVLGVGAINVATDPGTHNSLITFAMKGDWGPFGQTETEPDLPQSYEYIDDTHLVFTLRDEPIYWHDIDPLNGRQFTIEDLKYGIEALQNAPIQGPLYSEIDSIDTPDDKTFRLTFKQPAAYFLRASATPYQWIVAREQVEAGTIPQTPIGTGAFQLDKSTPDVGMTFTRNPKYFKTDPIYNTGKRLPFFDKIEATAMPDLATQNAAFASDKVDYAYAVNYSRTDIVERLRDRPDAVTVIVPPPPSYFPLIVMNSQTPPFTDVRVRRALSMAIDRDGLAQGIAGGVAAPSYGQDWTYFDRPQNPWPWTLNELGQYCAYNVKEAKQLLQAAGFDKGLGRQIELAFGTSDQGTNAATYLAMADMWKQGLGIDVNVTMAPDSASYTKKLRSSGGNYQDLMVATPLPAWDPDDWAYGQLNSKSTANFYKVNDPTLDDLTEKQRRILDVNERRQLLKQIMDRDLDQMYRLWAVDFYKFTIRSPKLFNIADHYLAWMTPGWGERKKEMAWKQA